jgi:hypothetical protein
MAESVQTTSLISTSPLSLGIGIALSLLILGSVVVLAIFWCSRKRRQSGKNIYSTKDLEKQQQEKRYGSLFGADGSMVGSVKSTKSLDGSLDAIQNIKSITASLPPFDSKADTKSNIILKVDQVLSALSLEIDPKPKETVAVDMDSHRGSDFVTIPVSSEPTTPTIIPADYSFETELGKIEAARTVSHSNVRELDRCKSIKRAETN